MCMSMCVLPVKACLFFSRLGASKQSLLEFLKTLKSRLFIQQTNTWTLELKFLND